MNELRNTILEKLFEGDIMPSPLMPLSVWLQIYIPDMFENDIIDALIEEEKENKNV